MGMSPRWLRSFAAWLDRVMPVLFVVVVTLGLGFGVFMWNVVFDTDAQVNRNTANQDQLIEDLATEVQRRQEGFCEVLDELWPAIARGLLGADPTDPDYRDDLTPVQRARDDAIRAEIRRTFPILEDCNLPPLIEEPDG